MAVYTITNEGFVPVLGLPEGVEEILQNVATIISSRTGTMPMSRDIGLSWDWLGMPLSRAQPQIVADVANAIAELEPRATLEDVEAETDDWTGEIKISARVVISDGE